MEDTKQKAIISLIGGFGNQLFQLFFIDRFCKSNDMIPGIYFSEEKYKSWFFENVYKFSKLAQTIDIIDKPENYITINEKIQFHVNDFFNRVKFAKNFHKNILFNGYFQTPLYWDNDLDYIKSNINIYPNIMVDIMNDFNKYEFKNCVSLNIRLGDYTNLTNLFQVFDEYNLIDCIKQFDDDKTFIVTSNDIEGAKSIIDKLKDNNHNFVFQDKKDDLIYDLYLQNICGSSIISNGTYSWWGAYLNKNNKQKIVSLKPWVFNGMGNNNDIIPKEDNWIQI